MRIFVLIIASLFPLGLSAAEASDTISNTVPVELACYWGDPSYTPSPETKSLAEMYSSDKDMAYFRIDLVRTEVNNNDSADFQKAIFRNLTLSTDSKEAEITIGYLFIKGLSENNSRLHISINRYSLASVMYLEAPSREGLNKSLRVW